MRADYPCIRVEVDEAAVVVTIDNPPANTWSKEALYGLKCLLSDLAAGGEARCLILTGSGPKYFSAGADLALFRNADQADAAAAMDRFAETFDALASFAGVTIAAINGYALGGGLEAALACDFRIAETPARMGLPEARVGVLPAGGGTQRLPLTVGRAWAKRMILLGEQLDAETALRIGLVDEVVAPGQAVTRAREWAALARLSGPAALRASKVLIDMAGQTGLAEGLARERAAFVGLFGTNDQAEGVEAFFEKRRPVWTNS